MKNVLIISSTPRVGGNSEILCKEFEKGAIEAGHNVDFVNLRDFNLKYCIGCYACRNTGTCFQKDGMDELYNKLKTASVIVFATPVYFYSMSGQLKVFIDRLTPVYEDIRADIYMIATMWDKNKPMMESTFEAIRGLTRDCFENCQEKGIIVGSDLSDRGEAQSRADLLKQAYEMGKNC